MHDTDTLTRNAVRELLELPVAPETHDPKQITIAIKARTAGWRAAMQQALEQLDPQAIARMYEARPLTDLRTRVVGSWQHNPRISGRAICMASRNREIGRFYRDVLRPTD